MSSWESVVQQTYNTGGQYAGSGVSPMTPYGPQDQLASQAQMNAINAAGPDVFDRAAVDIREQRRQLLDAIAGAGSAGRAEYQRQSQLNESSKQTQLASAVAAAQSRNADPGTLAALQGTISRPYQEGQSSLDAANANWQNLFNSMGISADQYATQYGNSIPVIQQQFKNDLASNFAITRANAQRDIEKGRQTTALGMAQISLDEALRQAQFREDEADDAAAAAQWQKEFDESQRRYGIENEWEQKKFDEDVRRFGLEYALKQAQLARSGSGGSGGGSGSGGYYGTGQTKTEIKDLFPGLVSGSMSALDRKTGGLVGSALSRLTGVEGATRGMISGSVSDQLGIPRSVGQGFLPPYDNRLSQTGQGIIKPGTGVSNPATRDAYQTKTYNWATDGLRQGLTPQQVEARMIADPAFGNNLTVKRVIAEAVNDWNIAHSGWANQIGTGVNAGVGTVGSRFLS